MKKNQVNKGRRSFFLKGTAALGAGLASAGAGAAVLFDTSQPLQQQIDHLQQKLDALSDREAINCLYMAFTMLLENRSYGAVVDLFTDDAAVKLHGVNLAGKAGVKKLFMEEYKEQKISVMHTAHRRDRSQKKDVVSVGEDRKKADASFYNQVLICKPIYGQSVLASMARQQGMTGQSYWENGRYDISFTRIRDQWQISRLIYHKV